MGQHIAGGHADDDQMHEHFSIALDPPLIIVTFERPQRILSWAMLHPGLQLTRRVAWLEVRNKDLPPDIDAGEVVRERISAAGLDDAVVLVTSRDIRRYRYARARVEDQEVRCLTTVGLSNSERVGRRLHLPPPFAGTINTLVHVAHPLSDAAMLEAVSIATEARTAAVLDAGVRRGGMAITGTGTDCIAIAAPPGDDQVRYAGKHTAVGEAIGAAVYGATAEGIRDWKLDPGAVHDDAEKAAG
ncbi:MAG: adenosylcobinamide amidohydrolase [Hyphomicrobium sp.]|jgi:adenosylcobinamide amidohydrolase